MPVIENLDENFLLWPDFSRDVTYPIQENDIRPPWPPHLTELFYYLLVVSPPPN